MRDDSGAAVDGMQKTDGAALNIIFIFIKTGEEERIYALNLYIKNKNNNNKMALYIYLYINKHGELLLSVYLLWLNGNGFFIQPWMMCRRMLTVRRRQIRKKSDKTPFFKVSLERLKDAHSFTPLVYQSVRPRTIAD